MWSCTLHHADGDGARAQHGSDLRCRHGRALRSSLIHKLVDTRSRLLIAHYNA